MRKNKLQEEKSVKVLRHSRNPKQVSKEKASQVRHVGSRKNPPPEKLAWLIAMVNLLPPDALANRTSQSLEEYAEQRNEDFEQLMRQAIERLPAKLREFVGLYPDVDGNDLKALEIIKARNPHNSRINWLDVLRVQIEVRWRYDLIVIGRDFLHEIAQGRSPYDMEMTVYLPQKWTADDKGLLVLKPTLLHACLSGAKLERIRECPICKKIYWAERMDQPTCSPRHNNIRRSRIQRGTYQPDHDAIDPK